MSRAKPTGCGWFRVAPIWAPAGVITITHNDASDSRLRIRLGIGLLRAALNVVTGYRSLDSATTEMAESAQSSPAQYRRHTRADRNANQ